MTSHELARKLLEMPDLPVVTYNCSYESEHERMERDPELIGPNEKPWEYPDGMKGQAHIFLRPS